MKLELDRLTKHYGTKIAVDRVSTTFTSGVYGLLGANGSGKTTLMRMICGVLRPTSGEILLDGTNTETLGEKYRDVLGYLPQDFGYYPDFSTLEFMRYIAVLKGIDSHKTKARSLELLEQVGLDAVQKAKIKTLSGGMKQRLGIAQAMLNDPKVLILDEPTAGLDPKERVRFRNLISQLSQDRIVILSTHIVSDVAYIANKILIMKQGAFLLEGSPLELEQEVRGKVWEAEVTPHEAEQLAVEHCIGNIHYTNEGSAVVRIVSPTLPLENARVVDPQLEDLYLYVFREEAQDGLAQDSSGGQASIGEKTSVSLPDTRDEGRRS